MEDDFELGAGILERRTTHGVVHLMEDDTIHSLLRDSNGMTFRFVFTDGEQWTAEVISDSHVDADDNILVERVDAGPQECGWQVRFAEIKSVADLDGRCLYGQG